MVMRAPDHSRSFMFTFLEKIGTIIPRIREFKQPKEGCLVEVIRWGNLGVPGKRGKMRRDESIFTFYVLGTISERSLCL
jgi:hypothetical protein